ncbi:putative FAD/NAD(P)-binding domain superfamily [Dioscorea sansibarensis]
MKIRLAPLFFRCTLAFRLCLASCINFKNTHQTLCLKGNPKEDAYIYKHSFIYCVCVKKLYIEFLCTYNGGGSDCGRRNSRVGDLVALRCISFECLVLERAPELRATGATIMLFPKAFRALDSLSVIHKSSAIYQPLGKGCVLSIAVGVNQELFLSARAPKFEMKMRCVYRKALLEALADELPPNTIRFSSKLASIKTEILNKSSHVYALHSDDGSIIRTKVVIGCDGVYSAVL